MQIRQLFIPVLLLICLTFGSASAQPVSLTDQLASDGRFTVLNTLLLEAGLAASLAGDDEFTVFAPTDDAFAAVPALVLDYLQANPALLERVLTYHLLPRRVDAASLLAEAQWQTVEGGPVSTNADLNRVNGADIIEPDIEATNGLIHAIDSVILPEVNLPTADPLISFDDIVIAGSSTVRPLTARMAENFARDGFSGAVTIEETGTNVGIERFCVNAELDIANASRPIQPDEVEQCRANGIEPVQFFVGLDALAITVSADNDFVENLTIVDLAAIFSGDAQTWDQVNSEYPAEPVQTFSPGDDSGTLVYFVDVVFDDDRTPILNAPNIQFSEDDNVLVQRVAASDFAIGYFGFAYFIENRDRLQVIDIEGVEPNERTAESGEYPLSRPLFIYSGVNIMQEKPQVAEFINFYISNLNDELGTGEDEIGYFPVSSDRGNLNRLAWLAAMAADGS